MTDPTTALLQTADDCHDDDPAQAATLLRDIDPTRLDAGQRPRYAFLLTHVFAEKLSQPADAWRRQQRLLETAGENAPLPLLRHAAAAARLAGDATGEAALVARIATAARVPLGQAAELVALAAASFRVSTLAGAVAGDAALTAFTALHGPAWQERSALDAAAAALCSNIVSDLAERPLRELQAQPLRRAMAGGAELAQAFWQRAGQWVQHERAHYLRALVANALGEHATAAAQARAGLVLLGNHDEAGLERVDQAFLRLELAHALASLGEAADARVERGLADAIAEAFDDPALTRWYQGRVARQAALSAAEAAAT